MERESFVTICRSWIGTPYLLRARVKGAGADCSTWMAESLIEAGIATAEDLYGGLNVNHHDWFHHARDDQYRARIMRHARQVAGTVCRRGTGAKPGSILLQKAAHSRVFNHGGVVTEWPMVIHCMFGGVVEVNAVKDPMWNSKAIEIFDPFGE